MKFSINTYFDDQDGSFVAENYFINGEQVSEEEYDAVIEEFEGEEDFENEVDTCECENDDCDCLECTLDYFVEQIQEINGGCPGCIREVLESFLDTIVDHIVIEDIDENDEYLN